MKKPTASADSQKALLLSHILAMLQEELVALFAEKQLEVKEMKIIGDGVSQRLRTVFSVSTSMSAVATLVREKVRPLIQQQSSSVLFLKVNDENIFHFASLPSMLRGYVSPKERGSAAKNRFVSLTELVHSDEQLYLKEYGQLRIFMEFVLKYKCKQDILTVQMAYQDQFKDVVALIFCKRKTPEQVIADFKEHGKEEYILTLPGSRQTKMVHISLKGFSSGLPDTYTYTVRKKSPNVPKKSFFAIPAHTYRRPPSSGYHSNSI